MSAILQRYRRVLAQDSPTSFEPGGPVPELAPIGPWRVVLTASRPLSGRITLIPGLLVTDAAQYIEHTLIDLELAVARKNTGRGESAFATLTNHYIAQLAACGCRARVEVVS